MPQESLLIILTVFVALVAISQVVQAYALVKVKQTVDTLHKQVEGMLPQAKKVLDEVQSTVPQVKKVLEEAQSTVSQTRKEITAITEKAQGILEVTKAQVHTVEGMLNDFSSRSKVQLDRVEMVLDDTLSRVHETVATVHNGVMKPIREISGVSAGIKAAFGQLMRGNGRPSVAQATSDEEMFI